MKGVIFNEGGKKMVYYTKSSANGSFNNSIYYSCTVYNALSPGTHEFEETLHLSLLPKMRELITLHNIIMR